MSGQMGAMLASGLDELRYEPIGKRIRAVLGGGTAVDSTRAVLVWEPRRIVPSYAVPADDIRGELAPSGTRTYCAYKGQASYWSATVGGRAVPDIAWTYQQPLHDATRVAGLIAFFDERVDVVVDGEHHERPITPWSTGPRTLPAPS
jgi:uncharacterized protein (DUF427 family)